MRVESFLTSSAARFPDKTALVVGEQRITYRQFDDLTDRLAAALQQRGVRRGQRVVIFMDNSVEACAAIFAALKADAVFSPVNPTTKPDKLAFILNNCCAQALLTQDKLLPAAAEALAHAPSVTVTIAAGAGEAPAALGHGGSSKPLVGWDHALASASPVPPPPAGIDIDLAMLIYTSGSTGFPKGVMMTHRNIVAAATSITTYLQNTPDDIILSVVPLSFDYGLYQLLMSMKMGATLVLERSFTYPQMVLQKLLRERVTGLPIVPTIAAILLQMKDLAPASFPLLRYITNTAAALPPAHIQRLQELFPTTRLYSMYGLTECKRCTYLPPDQLKTRPASVGKAIPNTEVYIVDDQDHRLGPNQVGELVIRGPHVMQGYWENPDATARALRPGENSWEKVLYSGDLFRMDDEGYLYFVGRKDDILKSRGEKVSPKEVENVLYAMPEVREAAVVGVPDTVLGMAIKAIIVPAEGATLNDQQVIRHCAAHMEDYMVPKLVEFRRDLPKSANGKIRRADLQAEASQTGAARASS